MIVGNEMENSYVEQCIGKKDPLAKVLRLLILQSLAVGIKTKQYEFLKTEIVQVLSFF